MQTKLILQLDGDLVEKAKAYAKTTGRSLSRIVADYLGLLNTSTAVGRSQPITRNVAKLKGAIKGSAIDEDDYRKYIEKKYL